MYGCDAYTKQPQMISKLNSFYFRIAQIERLQYASNWAL